MLCMNDTQALLERPTPDLPSASQNAWVLPSGLKPHAGGAPFGMPSRLEQGQASQRNAGETHGHSMLFAEAFERWRCAMLHLRKDGGESVRRSMLKDVLPWIGEHPIGTLRREEIASVLHRIVERGSSRQAGCVLADIRQLLRWALREGLIDDDPSSGLHKNHYAGDGRVRSRALSLDEVEELGRKMNSAGLAAHIRTAIWLMLATGVRIGEVATARWQDINLDTRTWTIPAHLHHSGQAHTVALSDFAVRHLRSATGHRRSPVWVFPSRDDSEPLSPKALGKQIRDRQRGTQIRGRSAATTMLLLSGGAWTPLDLRRTVAVLMSHLGIAPAVIASCLDQNIRGLTPQDSVMTNDSAESRDAFTRLGRYLEKLEMSASAPQRLAA